MTKMQVSATEFGVVRIFTVDISQDEIDAFIAANSDGQSPLSTALGATTLNPTYVEVFDIDDLEEMGLPRYMHEGIGISFDDVAQHRARLDQITGTVVIILSKAFAGTRQSLTPQAPLRWLGTYQEETPDRRIVKLQTDSANGVLTGPATKNRNPQLTLLWALLALPVVCIGFALLLWSFL
ncbi:MAG: hypothetical protein ABJO27_25635 [Pseudoruegeria sp.]